MTTTSGFGDTWSSEQRGVAVLGYAIAFYGGSTIGSVVGGALSSSNLRWTWTKYLTGIVMIALLILDILLCNGSYAPMLLVYKP